MRDRVVEPLVAVDELLDGDLRAVVDAAAGDRRVELVGRVDPLGARGAGACRRLDDDREADLGGELADVADRCAAAADRAHGTPAARSASFIAGLSRQR